ncbi:MAG: hypothetical protein M3308_00600, partial [Actinomycetota bacterium]|nr:hypothetical protein [Actinomycetota bacterium]
MTNRTVDPSQPQEAVAPQTRSPERLEMTSAALNAMVSPPVVAPVPGRGAAPKGGRSPATLLSLQRLAGNRAVATMLAPQAASRTRPRPSVAESPVGLQRLVPGAQVPTTIPDTPEAPLPTEQPAGQAATQTADLVGAASQINATRGGGGGGSLEALARRALSLFQGVVSRAAGMVTSGVSMVRGAGTGAASAVFGAARSAATAVKSAVTTGINAAKGMFSSVAGGLKAMAGSVATGALRRVSGVLQTVRGAIRSAVLGVINGGGDLASAIFGPVRAAVQRVLSFAGTLISSIQQRLSAALSSIIGAITGLIARIAAQLSAVVARVTDILSRALNAAQRFVERLRVTVDSAARGIAGALRRFVAGLINRLLSAVRSVASRILAVARRAVEWIRAKVLAWIARARTALTGLVRWAEQTIRRTAQRVLRGLISFVRGALAFGRQMLEAVKSFIRRTIQAILTPIGLWLLRRLIDRLRPQIEEAIRRVREMPRPALPGMPSIDDLREAGENISRTALEGVADLAHGLVSPQGDHFSVSVGGAGSGSA